MRQGHCFSLGTEKLKLPFGISLCGPPRLPILGYRPPGILQKNLQVVKKERTRHWKASHRTLMGKYLKNISSSSLFLLNSVHTELRERQKRKRKYKKIICRQAESAPFPFLHHGSGAQKLGCPSTGNPDYSRCCGDENKRKNLMCFSSFKLKINLMVLKNN